MRGETFASLGQKAMPKIIIPETIVENAKNILLLIEEKILTTSEVREMLGLEKD